MGPKKAKPTPAAGSSTEEPSGAMENPPIITWPDGKKEQLPELPDLHLGRRDLPTLDNEYESPVSYFCMFFSYDSEIEGRKLTREDVHGIMCMVFSERKQQNKVYDKFDNPEPNDGMVKMRKLEVKFRAPWILQVESWYKSLRERDSATEARHEALKGFPGRMPHMNLVMPTINNITLEGYQVCTHYTVLKFGKTRANEDMAESEKSAALSLYYGVAIRESFPLSRTLKNENKSITEQTKVIVDEYKEFFKGAADKVIDKWEVDLQGMKSRYKEATASQSNPSPVVTAGFAAMTMGATANNPYGLSMHEYQRGMRPMGDPSSKGKGKETFDLDDYVDPEAYEEDPPAAGGGRGMEQRGLGKRSQRDSTSGSREEEGGSKKGKQAVRKKQREDK